MEILQDNYEDNCHLLQVTWQGTLWDKFISCTLLTALLVKTIWALCFFRKFFSDFARHSCTKFWIWTLPYKHFTKVTSLGVYFLEWLCFALLFSPPLCSVSRSLQFIACFEIIFCTYRRNTGLTAFLNQRLPSFTPGKNVAVK